MHPRHLRLRCGFILKVPAALRVIEQVSGQSAFGVVDPMLHCGAALRRDIQVDGYTVQLYSRKGLLSGRTTPVGQRQIVKRAAWRKVHF